MCEAVKAGNQLSAEKINDNCTDMKAKLDEERNKIGGGLLV